MKNEKKGDWSNDWSNDWSSGWHRKHWHDWKNGDWKAESPEETGQTLIRCFAFLPMEICSDFPPDKYMDFSFQFRV